MSYHFSLSQYKIFNRISFLNCYPNVSSFSTGNCFLKSFFLEKSSRGGKNLHKELEHKYFEEFILIWTNNFSDAQQSSIIYNIAICIFFSQQDSCAFRNGVSGRNTISKWWVEGQIQLMQLCMQIWARTEMSYLCTISKIQHMACACISKYGTGWLVWPSFPHKSASDFLKEESCSA